jgi:hypothetical protein
MVDSVVSISQPPGRHRLYRPIASNRNTGAMFGLDSRVQFRASTAWSSGATAVGAVAVVLRSRFTKGPHVTLRVVGPDTRSRRRSKHRSPLVDNGFLRTLTHPWTARSDPLTAVLPRCWHESVFVFS